jgi:drug/metabolite transporter (DMT)-like permease
VAAGTLWMLPPLGWQAAQAGVLPTSGSAWAAILFVGVFSSALAHGLWVRGVARIGPNRASVFIHLMPVFGALLAITFLGEQLGAYHVAGGLLTVLGILLTTRR